HPNLATEIFGSSTEPSAILVMVPLAETNCNAYLKSGKADFVKTLQLFKGVIEGIQHMHQKGVVHGDIKLDNILVNKGLGIVTDFGCSILENELSDQIGGKEYRDPLATGLDAKCDDFAILMNLYDVFSSKQWLNGTKEQNAVINDLKNFLQTAIL